MKLHCSHKRKVRRLCKRKGVLFWKDGAYWHPWCDSFVVGIQPFRLTAHPSQWTMRANNVVLVPADRHEVSAMGHIHIRRIFDCFFSFFLDRPCADPTEKYVKSNVTVSKKIDPRRLFTKFVLNRKKWPSPYSHLCVFLQRNVSSRIIASAKPSNTSSSVHCYVSLEHYDLRRLLLIWSTFWLFRMYLQLKTNEAPFSIEFNN